AFFSADMPADLVQHYEHNIQDESYYAFLDMLVFDLPRPQRVRARQTIPTMVIGGADDHIFTPREVQQTAHAYGGDAEIFLHMAHDMMLEANWRQVADRMLAWLEETIPTN